MMPGKRKAAQVMETVTEAARSIGTSTVLTFAIACLALAISCVALISVRRSRIS